MNLLGLMELLYLSMEESTLASRINTIYKAYEMLKNESITKKNQDRFFIN